MIRQFDINALWDLDISFGSIFLRRLAMDLEINLYMTLQRLMGQKSLALSGLFIFGIKEINV